MNAPAPGVGQEVGDYVLNAQLGEGGMGVVYSATHRVIGKKAAVKLMRPRLCADEESVKRFFNEAVLTASIRHPGIVEIYDYGVHDSGSAFIAMALLEGESLETRLRDRGAFPLLDSLRIARQIAGALAAAHNAGVVHRDLKPDNVFLTIDPDVPGGERTQLLDFGIAKLLGDEEGSAALTRTGTVLGTPLYMSPEQCRGKSNLDGRTDLYALGCMLYQMLSGRPPFSGESALEVGAAHVRDEPDPISSLCPGLAPEICALVHRMLAKRPDERPDGAADVAERLTDLIATIETSPLAGRERVATIPFPARNDSGSLELAATAGTTTEDGMAATEHTLSGARGDSAVERSAGAAAGAGSRRARIAALATLSVLIVGGGAILALRALQPSADQDLASAFAAPPGCQSDTLTCRRFADMVRRGDGVQPDLAYARSILEDACEWGDPRACLDEITFEQRASIPLGRFPSIGSRLSLIDLVVALDPAVPESNGTVLRIGGFSEGHNGDVRVHVVPMVESNVGELLAVSSCILEAEHAFPLFDSLRNALLRGQVSGLPKAEDLVTLAGGDPDFAVKHRATCEKLVRQQREALALHGVTKPGTLFVSGRRLEPPYSDAAVDALIDEVASQLQVRDVRISSKYDRVASSRVRRDIEPNGRGEQPVQMVTYCDPSTPMCHIAMNFFENFPGVFGPTVKMSLIPVAISNDYQRSVAACAAARLGLGEEIRDAQIKAPRLEGKLQWLEASDIVAVMTKHGRSQGQIREQLEVHCPAEMRIGRDQLLTARGELKPTTFVNGRPAPLGKLSEIKSMVLEELEFAEKLGFENGRTAAELRALLLQYDNEKPFSGSSIEPPNNLR